MTVITCNDANHVTRKSHNDTGNILEEYTFFVATRLELLGFQYRPDSMVEHVLEASLGQRRTLDIGHTVRLFLQLESLGLRYGALFGLFQLIEGILVFSEIQLGPHQYYWCVGAVVPDLRYPLLSNIRERVRVYNTEAHQENVSLGVGEGPQSIVVFLTGSIPQTQVDGSTVDHDVGAVVVEHSRYILPREGVTSVGDEETCFTDRAVSDHHTLDVLHCSNLC